MTSCLYPRCPGGEFGAYCKPHCAWLCPGGTRPECEDCWRKNNSELFRKIIPWNGHGSCPDKIPSKQ